MPAMLTYPQIDPVALELGSLKIHWYGVMYLIAFLAGWALGTWRCKDAFRGWQRRHMDDVLFYVALGIIIGGRLGYVAFYAPGQFLSDPSMLFKVWQGGMSFHGGLLGTMFAMWWFARRRGWAFFKVADFIAPLVPIGLGAGRVGNFINGNLWGKPTDGPWGMVFPSEAAGDVARHPSQLYEAFLEGAVLFIILWWFSRRPRPMMSVSGLFLLGYGVFRFAVEFVRVPDAHIGYLAFDWFTMGHLLTLPMVLGGLALLWLAYRRGEMPEAAQEVDGDAVAATAGPTAGNAANPASGEAAPAKQQGRRRSAKRGGRKTGGRRKRK